MYKIYTVGERAGKVYALAIAADRARAARYKRRAAIRDADGYRMGVRVQSSVLTPSKAYHCLRAAGARYGDEARGQETPVFRRNRHRARDDGAPVQNGHRAVSAIVQNYRAARIRARSQQKHRHNHPVDKRREVVLQHFKWVRAGREEEVP